MWVKILTEQPEPRKEKRTTSCSHKYHQLLIRIYKKKSLKLVYLSLQVFELSVELLAFKLNCVRAEGGKEICNLCRSLENYRRGFAFFLK